jgi:L-fucose isomerase-like protein
MPQPTVAVVSLITPWFDTAAAEAYLRGTRVRVGRRFTVVGPERPIVTRSDLDGALAAIAAAPTPPSALLLQIGAFPDGAATTRVAEACRVPIVVHSVPEPSLATSVPLNSLCGANMATFTFTHLGLPHSWVHADPEDEAGGDLVEQHLRAACALNGLRGARLSLVGSRAPGFYPCVYDELLLRRRFGVEVEYVDPHEVRRRVDLERRRPAPQRSFPMIGGGELSAEAVAWMEAHYAALWDALTSGGHDMVAIRDWPELETFDPTIPGGLWPALGWVQDDGIDLAPEGDVHGALTGRVASALGDARPFFTDVSAWDDASSSLTLWHYGGPTSLSRDPLAIRFGPEGRNVEFTLKPGRGHLIRIGLGTSGLRMLTIEVEVEDRAVTIGRAGGVARTLRTPAAEVIRTMLDRGWEHHVTLLYGRRTEAIRAFAKQAGLPLTEM